MNMNDDTVRVRSLLIHEVGASSWRVMSYLDMPLQPNY